MTSLEPDDAMHDVTAWLIVVILINAAHLKRALPDLTYHAEEEQEAGTLVGNLTRDVPLNTSHSVDARIRFRVLRQEQDYFSLGETTGVLRTARALDRDALCPGLPRCALRLDIAVQAAQYFRIVKVMVEVLDVNDNAPVWSEASVAYDMVESSLPGLSVTLPAAHDADSPQYGVARYELMSGDGVFVVRAAQDEVLLVLTTGLDRETRSEYELRVVVYDGGAPPRSATLPVHVNVLDTNDNAPVFDLDQYEVWVDEDTPPNSHLVHVHATDRDAHLNAHVVYSLSERTLTKHGADFSIDDVSGDVYLVSALDYEHTAVYHLAVTARDLGPDSIPTTARLTVHVNDVNDVAPRLTVSTLSGAGLASVEEGAASGTFVAHVTVTDADTGRGGQFNCSLVGACCELVEEGGGEYQVRTAGELDREQSDHYTLTVLCADHGAPPLTTRHIIHLNVTDVNDNSPAFSRPLYSATIIENNYIGAEVVRVAATDADLAENASLTYGLEGHDAVYFTVDALSGVIRAVQSLDREARSELNVTVTATDQGRAPRWTSTLVVVSVLDVNDERPQFNVTDYSFSVAEHSPAYSVLGQVRAEDADLPPNNGVVYHLMASQAARSFSVDSSTGTLTTTSELDREEAASYGLVVCAADTGHPPLSSSVSVTVHISDINDHAPRFSFPTSHNNKVYLSNRAPQGQLVTRVHAHDLDTGSSGRVSYAVLAVGGGEDGVFVVDSERGAVLLNASLTHLDTALFSLSLEACDHGQPPLRTRTTLYIAINSTVPQLLTDDSTHDHHIIVIIMIIIVVVGVTTVITVVLVILVVRRRRHRSSIARYNCRLEARKVTTTSLHYRDEVGAQWRLTNGTTTTTTTTTMSSLNDDEEDKDPEMRHTQIMTVTDYRRPPTSST